MIAHVLLTDTAGRVCLVDTVFKDDWELPGGIVDPFESPKQGARRELMEELSLDATPGRLLVVDWLGPYLGWEDALELIFDGGTLAPDQGAALQPAQGALAEVVGERPARIEVRVLQPWPRGATATRRTSSGASGATDAPDAAGRPRSSDRLSRAR